MNHFKFLFSLFSFTFISFINAQAHRVPPANSKGRGPASTVSGTSSASTTRHERGAVANNVPPAKDKGGSTAITVSGPPQQQKSVSKPEEIKIEDTRPLQYGYSPYNVYLRNKLYKIKNRTINYIKSTHIENYVKSPTAKLFILDGVHTNEILKSRNEKTAYGKMDNSFIGKSYVEFKDYLIGNNKVWPFDPRSSLDPEITDPINPFKVSNYTILATQFLENMENSTANNTPALIPDPFLDIVYIFRRFKVFNEFIQFHPWESVDCSPFFGDCKFFDNKLALYLKYKLPEKIPENYTKENTYNNKNTFDVLSDLTRKAIPPQKLTALEKEFLKKILADSINIFCSAKNTATLTDPQKSFWQKILSNPPNYTGYFKWQCPPPKPASQAASSP